jgi:hypothetical protein
VVRAFLAGCAEMEATNTKSLLSTAGFYVRTPETPKQKEILLRFLPITSSAQG